MSRAEYEDLVAMIPDECMDAYQRTEIFNGVTFVSQGHAFTLGDPVTGCAVTIQDVVAVDWMKEVAEEDVLAVLNDMRDLSLSRTLFTIQDTAQVAATDVKPDNPQVYPDWVDTSEHRDAKHVIDHILGGKIGAPGRQALRKAIDTVDAGPQGRAKHDQALGRALRLSPPGIVP
jgi:hypothetical protein